VRTSDGPNGVRGRNFFNGVPSSCFPSGTGLAASFDRAMMRRVGEALGDECRAKSAHVLLGPTINIQRSPLGGRGFESYSEDPLLSGLRASPSLAPRSLRNADEYLTHAVAAEYVNGVQSKGVAACIKHFVANDQEFERFSSDSASSLLPLALTLVADTTGCFQASYRSAPSARSTSSRSASPSSTPLPSPS